MLKTSRTSSFVSVSFKTKKLTGLGKHLEKFGVALAMSSFKEITTLQCGFNYTRTHQDQDVYLLVKPTFEMQFSF